VTACLLACRRWAKADSRLRPPHPAAEPTRMGRGPQGTHGGRAEGFVEKHASARDDQRHNPDALSKNPPGGRTSPSPTGLSRVPVRVVKW
jgi:hypothetical protein